MTNKWSFFPSEAAKTESLGFFSFSDRWLLSVNKLLCRFKEDLSAIDHLFISLKGRRTPNKISWLVWKSQPVNIFSAHYLIILKHQICSCYLLPQLKINSRVWSVKAVWRNTSSLFVWRWPSLHHRPNTCVLMHTHSLLCEMAGSGHITPVLTHFTRLQLQSESGRGTTHHTHDLSVIRCVNNMSLRTVSCVWLCSTHRVKNHFVNPSV